MSLPKAVIMDNNLDIDGHIRSTFNVTMPEREVMVLHLDDDIHVWVDRTLWIHEDISDDDGLFRFIRHSPGTPVTMIFPYPA